jgi:amino acid transporter
VTASSFLSQTSHQGVGGASVQLPRERRLTLVALACLAFFTASGGAFGLEPLVGSVGPGWAVVLIVLTPLIWSLPMALMVAELATLMPDEGGYYVWVREALGPFWGVQEAWWSMGYSVVLLAIFPVLFVSYLTFFIPALAPAVGAPAGMGGVVRWFVAVLVIVSAMAVNLLGARDVGRSAKLSATFVLGAFALLVLAWLKRGQPLGTVSALVARDLCFQSQRSTAPGSVDHRFQLLGLG